MYESVTSVTVPIDFEPFPFRWQVELAGYEWARGLLDSEWRLVARLPGLQQRGIRVYEPLKDNRLFLSFAAVKPTRRAILQFADKYGTLFDNHDLEESVRRPSGQYDSSQVYGTRFVRWKSEIERMGRLVRIWNAVKSGRGDQVKNMIHWKGNNAVGYKLGTRWGWLATPEINKFLLMRFKRNELLKPAMYLLQREINQTIAEADSLGYAAIVPRLVWCPGPRIHGMPRPDHHQRLIFQPTNLLAAIWLQFAKAVTEEYQLRFCQGCGEVLQIGKGARRSHSKTCSPRCRQRVSRAKRLAN